MIAQEETLKSHLYKHLEMSIKSLQPEHLRIELVPVAKVEDALRYLFQ